MIVPCITSILRNCHAQAATTEIVGVKRLRSRKTPPLNKPSPLPTQVLSSQHPCGRRRTLSQAGLPLSEPTRSEMIATPAFVCCYPSDGFPFLLKAYPLIDRCRPTACYLNCAVTKLIRWDRYTRPQSSTTRQHQSVAAMPRRHSHGASLVSASPP